jgi:hypothetical protein
MQGLVRPCGQKPNSMQGLVRPCEQKPNSMHELVWCYKQKPVPMQGQGLTHPPNKKPARSPDVSAVGRVFLPVSYFT